jgi:hypothetical protein
MAPSHQPHKAWRIIKFHTAYLDQLHATDLARGCLHVPGGGSAISDRVSFARDFIWSRLIALGGFASLPGSLAWNVIGVDLSLHAWAAERSLYGRTVGNTEARGILTSVLSMLAVDTTSRW